MSSAHGYLMKFDSSYFWSPKYAKWIIISLSVFLFLLIILKVTSLIGFRKEMRVAMSQDPAPIQKKALPLNAHVNTELFGTYVPADLNADEVTESKLQLELVGILFADNKDDSQVIIRAPNGIDKTYGLGDIVPGNAIIKRIMPNGVLVEREGVLESLMLPKNELKFEPVPAPLIKD
jgi:general secretion pathway protein C